MTVAITSAEPEPHLRTSSYVIYVDLPGTRDEWLIVHGYTGTYDRVNRPIAAYLRSLETANVPKPLYGQWESEEIERSSDWRPSDSMIEHLIRRGYLTEKTADEEEQFFADFVAQLHEAQKRTPPALVILPTYDCNLRCHYCFQDHMRTDPQFRRLLKPMSLEMADRIMSSFEGIERNLHGVENAPRSFTFFGGEPLLAISRPVVEHIMRKQAALRKCRFTAVTNGTQLEAYEDLLGPEWLSSLQITIDGPPDDHDRRRIHADGTGSFAQIARNLEMALDRGTRIAVRVNVDRHNFDRLEPLAETMEKRGWSRQPNFHAYLAPVHDYAGSGKAGDRSEFFNSWELGQQLRELQGRHQPSQVFAEVDGAIRARAKALFQTRGMDDKRTVYCGAHSGMYLFDAFGDIYACWDRTGDDRLKMGTVAEDGSVHFAPLFEMWRSRNVASNATCRRCRFALNCGGGCAVMAEVSSGTIFSNYCDVYGKRFRAAVAEAYLQSDSGESTESADAMALFTESLK